MSLPALLTDPQEAAARLLAGSLVGLPTETVYGLGARALDSVAVRRVFEVKGRPVDHPLIVHLADAADATAWAAEIPSAARRLMAEHWPGPLTVVLPRRPFVPDGITGGQPTVALRVPTSDLTRAAIRELGRRAGGPPGVVAPSANRYGAVSPTTAGHVVESLGRWLAEGDAVLDGGPCDIGVESTVVSVDSSDEVRLLRPGAVVVPGALAPDGTVRAPGSAASHYAPAAAVLLVEAGGLPELGGAVGLLAPAEVATPEGWVRLAAPVDDTSYARVLYSALRAADSAGLDVVVAVPPTSGPLRAVVLDRLTRATVRP